MRPKLDIYIMFPRGRIVSFEIENLINKIVIVRVKGGPMIDFSRTGLHQRSTPNS